MRYTEDMTGTFFGYFGITPRSGSTNVGCARLSGDWTSSRRTV